MTPSSLSIEDQPPVTSLDEARERVADLVGHAISRQLWLMLFDAAGRQLPLVIPVGGIPLRPDPGDSVQMASGITTILADCAPGGSVVLTLERPGGAALTAPDQAWARELRASFGKVLPILGLFVAHDSGVADLAE
ncbi:hypothetical protein E3O44_01870 [Cryobacterium algoricola]|uniref:Uncharacterized protein n=1 Tax=Cryobacterium algoricola TaxID=1259183 RepID=A0ABY2II79_9MICO|nr:hypothetical protein [Cryobacterium algoricola]TFB90386.1 hypothetical protein E3O44_01870 [Cryobacterium algoricola]